jgi:Ca2+-binding EF-hand superfamily protein
MFSGMFDKDNSATIDFNEFKSLWQFITQWEKVFRGFDEDKSGSIDKTEFRKALTSFGNKYEKRKE